MNETAPNDPFEPAPQLPPAEDVFRAEMWNKSWANLDPDLARAREIIKTMSPPAQEVMGFLIAWNLHQQRVIERMAMRIAPTLKPRRTGAGKRRGRPPKKAIITAEAF